MQSSEEKEDELREDKSVWYYRSTSWKVAKATNEGIYGPYKEFYKKWILWSKYFVSPYN